MKSMGMNWTGLVDRTLLKLIRRFHACGSPIVRHFSQCCRPDCSASRKYQRSYIFVGGVQRETKAHRHKANPRAPSQLLGITRFLHAEIRLRTIFPRIGSRLISASHWIETDDVDAARREHQQRQVVWNTPSIVLRQPPLKRYSLTIRVIYLIGLVRPGKEEPARRPVLAESMAADVCAMIRKRSAPRKTGQHFSLLIRKQLPGSKTDKSPISFKQ